MDENKIIGTSKFLSLILRHDPGSIGLSLDGEGWADLPELAEKAAVAGKALTHDSIAEVMALPGKKRFEISSDGRRIRAMQGHSTPEVSISYQPVTPPETLYHGTATRFLASIRAEGLKPGDRQYVHLSPDRETAAAVGRRHGMALVLEVAAADMHHRGDAFFCAANGVWLTRRVPAACIRFPDPSA